MVSKVERARIRCSFKVKEADRGCCALQCEDTLKTRLDPQLLPVFAAVASTNELVRSVWVPRRPSKTVGDAERGRRQESRAVVSKSQPGGTET